MSIDEETFSAIVNEILLAVDDLGRYAINIGKVGESEKIRELREQSFHDTGVWNEAIAAANKAIVAALDKRGISVAHVPTEEVPA